MKINQYCSVCKKHLDMEVIPTDDGGDDGVIWLRCPECQGFLPKFTGEGLKTEPAASDQTTEKPADDPVPSPPPPPPPPTAPAAPEIEAETPTAYKKPGKRDDSKEPEAPAEPVAEYAAMLAAADTTAARPYRPSSTYEEGEVVLHLAYDDVGIVVAKEQLPGGRKAVKVFFDGAGVVHLIEQAADGH